MSDFEKRRKEIGKKLLEVSRKYNLPIYYSKFVSEMSQQELIAHAENVRKQNLDACNYSWNHYLPNSREKRDLEFEKLAYQSMTPEEILMSEQREAYVKGVELSNFLIDLKISKLNAQRPKFNPPRARAIA